MSTPANRPILFSAPMVRALLAGTKMQTRRAVKLPHRNPLGIWEPSTFGGSGTFTRGKPFPEQPCVWHTRTGHIVLCPYGVPGDLLWVRESGWQRMGSSGTFEPYYYAATDSEFAEYFRHHAPRFKRRPSIHMPRWASRITLRITDVRVERLQKISETDAAAEGVMREEDRPEERRRGALCPQCQDTGLYMRIDPRSGGAQFDTDCTDCDTFAKRYRWLWESINGPDSWASNPFVWVVAFERAQT
jgi:hypothetical protein